MKRIRFLASAAISCLVLAGGAQAATLTSSSTNLPADAFTSPSQAANTLVGVKGSVSGYYASPFGDTTSPYVAVEGGGYAIYDLAGRYLSFVFGSPDDYNTISFLNSSGTVFDTFVPSNPPLNRADNYDVTIKASGSFSAVEFSSSTNAFEFSNVSVSNVPLPATAPMFGAALLALGGFGYALNRWIAPKSRDAAAA